MDTFTTRTARPVRHHSAQGFCTVCGTVWPCWRGVCEDDSDAVRRSVPPLVAAIGGWS
jgi:hypothetical protein